jgi:hypothetical protein
LDLAVKAAGVVVTGITCGHQGWARRAVEADVGAGHKAALGQGVVRVKHPVAIIFVPHSPSGRALHSEFVAGLITRAMTMTITMTITMAITKTRAITITKAITMVRAGVYVTVACVIVQIRRPTCRFLRRRPAHVSRRRCRLVLP